MSLAAIIDAMLAAGCSAEQVAAAAKAHEVAREKELARIAAIPPWPVQVKAVFKRDGKCCQYCGETEGPFEVDHVIPRSKGGNNDLSNLVVACQSCNRSKKDRNADEFRSSAAARQAHYRARKAAKDAKEIAAANGEEGITRHNATVTVSSPDVTNPNDVAPSRHTGVPLEVPPKDNNQTPLLDPSPVSDLRASALRSQDFLAKADEFYGVYPKKVDPTDAKAKFIRLAKSGVDPDRIIEAARKFGEAHRIAGTEKKYIKAPAVWLNKGGYASEDLPEPDGANQARAGPMTSAEPRKTIFDAARSRLENRINLSDDPLSNGESGGIRRNPLRLLSAN